MDASSPNENSPLEMTDLLAEQPADGLEMLETVEFELALQLQDIGEQGFDGAVNNALDSVGGTLLFDMPIGIEPDCRRVAAVSLGSGDQRLLALVVQQAEGDTLTVESAERSTNPVAGIVAAYAGVMEHLAAAA